MNDGATGLVAPVRISRLEHGWPGRALVLAVRLSASASRRMTGGRGVGLLCESAGRVLARGGVVAFDLANGGQFLVGARDRYWLIPLLLEQSYERGLDCFLGRTIRRGDRFLDCGANLGLWSVAAAAVLLDPAHVVAVEPGAATFAQLQRNQAANKGSFKCLRLAVASRSDEQVRLYTHPTDQASSTLVEDLSPGSATPETVTTVCLDDLLRRRRPPTDRSSVTFVKLDIEGMERTVIATFDSAAYDDVMLLYEDHGRDATSAATAVALDRGLAIYLPGDDGRLRLIERSCTLSGLKVDPAIGYNLVAFHPRGRAADRFRQTHAGLTDP